MTIKQVKALLDEYIVADAEIKAALKRLKDWQEIGGAFIVPLAEKEAVRNSERIQKLSQLKAAVECALNELPSVQRNSIRKHRIERKSSEIAAHEMNYSVRQFQYHYRNGLQQLAECNVLNDYLRETDGA